MSGHDVATAFKRGWQMLQNGELLIAAEAAGFEALVTTDKNIRRQQNPDGRKLAILVLPTTDWRRTRNHTDLMAHAIERPTPGAYVELSFPKP